MRTHLACGLAAAALGSGCAAVEAVDSMFAEMDRRAEESRFEAARVACSKYGFKVETDAYAQCLQTEVNNIKNREAIAAAAALANSKPATPATDAPAAPTAPQTISCRRTLLGTVDCTTR